MLASSNLVHPSSYSSKLTYMQKHTAFILLIGFILPTLAFADLPLTVENLVADKGRWTIESGIVYGNSKSTSTALDGTISIDIGNHSYITLPSRIDTVQRQSEYLVGTMGARYGISPKTDVGFLIGGTYHSEQQLNTDKRHSTHSLNAIDLTATHQLLPDGKYPAVVGFANLGVFEERGNRRVYFSNLSAGLTAYRSYDPIVLSLSTGYKYHRAKTHQDETLKPSDIFFVNPQVAFAANEQISLMAGVNFRHIGSQTQNHLKSQSINDTDLTFGLSYGLNHNTNLNFMAVLKQNFENAHEFRLNYSKKF